MTTINQVSKSLDIPPKTIRYYEEIGLLSPIHRSNNGYRYFTTANIDELRLIKGARIAGFNIEESKELMGLFRNSNRKSKDVKALTLEKTSQLKERITALNDMLIKLENLSESCLGDEESDCAILNGLTKE
jgi:MerR family copper efflux transcriptional regulator